MKNFMKYTLATIVGLLLYSIISAFLFLGIVGTIATMSQNKEEKVKDNSILYLKFDNQIVDRASNNPLENFNFAAFQGEHKTGLNTILENLKKAKKDDHIKGIFMELSYVPAGIATIEEIRNALLDFKESGKFIYTYSDVMTQGTYYLATASDKIFMNPVGTMELKGLRAKISFFKGTLEKLGIEPVIFRHGKFKSAVEPFMLDKMSDANKEQTISFVQSIWDHVVANIAKQRSLTPETVNKIADQFLIRNPQSAVENGIIDGALYRDQVIDQLVELTGAKSAEKLELVKFSKYENVKPEKKSKKLKQDKIAIIYASGEIGMGKGDNGSIGSEDISAALRKARRDTTIKAIVFRVNSPGGSALASDIIWREVVLAKKAKPFIVSMGDLAASGGYYISCPADTIVASPVTITGSIGVFGLMFNTQKLMNQKLGVTFDGVKTNKFADLPDLTRPMSEAEKEIIQTGVEDIYSTFLGHVSEGRNMATTAVDEIGQGRVWSGANAKEIGLVDVFGGLETAVSIAAEKAGLTDYRRIELPEMLDPFEEIVKQLTGDVTINLIQHELGENYFMYEKLKNLTKLQGIQARMTYDLELY